MKVLEPGRQQQGWATEAKCTGSGNGNGGCGAKLLVDESDLFTTSSQSYGDTSPEVYVTFKCAQCGVLTDITNYPRAKWGDLPKRAPRSEADLSLRGIVAQVAGQIDETIASGEEVDVSILSTWMGELHAALRTK